MTLLERIREAYPNASPATTKQDAIDYLNEQVPALIHRHMLEARSVKVCSGISPEFADIASEDGIATAVASTPKHFYNVMLTDEGPLAVDLSDIQFRLCYPSEGDPDWPEDADPFGDRTATSRALLKIASDPFEAVKVWDWEGDPASLRPPQGRQMYLGHDPYLAHTRTMQRLRPHVENPARSLDDLPDGARIGVVEDFDEDDDKVRSFIVYYADSHGHPLPSSRDNIDDPEPEKYFSGVVRTLYRPACQAYEVIYSIAAPGWGPLLYDTAIELASQYGGGLMSDRKAVSDAACRVWTTYRSRPDVSQRELPPRRACAPGAECSTEVAFTKGPTNLNRLEAERKILYFDDAPPGAAGVMPLPDPEDATTMARPIPLHMVANVVRGHGYGGQAALDFPHQLTPGQGARVKRKRTQQPYPGWRTVIRGSMFERKKNGDTQVVMHTDDGWVWMISRDGERPRQSPQTYESRSDATEAVDRFITNPEHPDGITWSQYGSHVADAAIDENPHDVAEGIVAEVIIGYRECLGDSVHEVGGDRDAWSDALIGFDARVRERLGDEYAVKRLSSNSEKHTARDFYDMGRANAEMAIDQASGEYEGDIMAALASYGDNVSDTAAEWGAKHGSEKWKAAQDGFWSVAKFHYDAAEKARRVAMGYDPLDRLD